MTDLKFKDWFMGTCPHMEGPHVTLYIGPHNGGYTTTLTHTAFFILAWCRLTETSTWRK